jgi:hypothetical protein
MKQLGVSAAIVGQLVVGSLGGAAYAIIVGRAGRSEGEGRRFGRPGVTFVAGAVGVAWLAILALLWPVLDTNFRGLPPGTASVVTALGLLFSFAVFGVALVLTYRYMTGRAPTGRVVESGTPRVGRRAFLAGGAGWSWRSARGSCSAASSTRRRLATTGCGPAWRASWCGRSRRTTSSTSSPRTSWTRA